MNLRCTVLALVAVSVGFAQEGPTPSWLAFDDASVGIRLVEERSSTGGTTADQWQYHDVLAGKVFVDPEHNYSFNFLIGNGDAFPGGWSNTGAGSAPASGKTYLKQFFADAKPVQGVEVQWGGIGMERGASTPVTSYSGDGFMTGERFYIRNSEDLYFDKVAFTFGYLGRVDQPNVWDRANTLWMNNYQQYLLEKKFSSRVTGSADYTVVAGERTLREAAHVNLPQWKVMDNVQFDMYERTNHTAAAGGHLGVGKKLNKTVEVRGGYASIDRNYGDLNDDAFFHGRRVYMASTIHLGRGFAVTPMYDHAAGNSYVLPNDTHFHLAFTYDFLKLLGEKK
ncbi:MAG: hypothetical protein JO061_07870 [Acidobacteriaceae bacterium]|nr:hypothetical protein [Acidobacteriaceae bacterium]